MKRILLCTILVFIIHYEGFSQSDKAVWKQYSGPYSGAIHSFANYGDTIFAGSGSSGVFKSIDNGYTWSLAISDIQVPYLFDIDNSLFIGLDRLYKYNSSNTEMIAISNDQIGSVHAVHMFNGILFASTDNGVFRYNSTQKKWVKKNKGLMISHYSLYWIRSLSSIGDILYCGSIYTGLYKSIDEGENWQKIEIAGNPPDVYTLVTHNDYIYKNGFLRNNLSFSPDKGQNWLSLEYNLPDTGIRNMIVFENNLLIFTDDGVYKLNEIEKEWNLISTKKFEYVHVKEDVLLTSNVGGIYRWDEETDDFILSNKGINSSYVIDIKLFNHKIFVATQGGVYVTPEEEDNWYKIPELEGFYTSSLEKKDTLLFAGTNKGMFVTSVSRIDWQKIELALTHEMFWDIKVTGNDIYVATDDGVFISKNNGGTWKHLPNSFSINNQISNLGINEKILIAGNTHGLYKILADSSDWENINFFNGKDVSSINIIDEVIFVSVLGEPLYRSTDYGKSWVQTDVWTGHRSNMIKRGENIYATAHSNIVFSSDGGNSWINYFETEMPSALISCITEGDNKFYAGTFWKSIWYRPFLTSTGINSTVYQISDNEIYLPDQTNFKTFRSNVTLAYGASAELEKGLDDTGIFKDSNLIEEEDKIKITAEDGKTVKELKVIRKNLVTAIPETKLQAIKIYPVPATEYLFVNEAVKIKSCYISNVQGKKIAQPTFHENYIELTSLPKGIYFLTIISESNTKEVFKFIKE